MGTSSQASKLTEHTHYHQRQPKFVQLAQAYSRANSDKSYRASVKLVSSNPSRLEISTQVDIYSSHRRNLKIIIHRRRHFPRHRSETHMIPLAHMFIIISSVVFLIDDPAWEVSLVCTPYRPSPFYRALLVGSAIDLPFRHSWLTNHCANPPCCPGGNMRCRFRSAPSSDTPLISLIPRR